MDFFTNVKIIKVCTTLAMNTAGFTRGSHLRWKLDFWCWKIQKPDVRVADAAFKPSYLLCCNFN